MKMIPQKYKKKDNLFRLSFLFCDWCWRRFKKRPYRNQYTKNFTQLLLAPWLRRRMYEPLLRLSALMFT